MVFCYENVDSLFFNIMTEGNFLVGNEESGILPSGISPFEMEIANCSQILLLMWL